MAQRSVTAGETKSTGSGRRTVMWVAAAALLAVVAAGCAVPPPAEGANDAIPALAVATGAPAVSGVAYGPLPEQLLDVHLPTGRTGPFPVIVYVHGGGWIAGTRAVIPDFLLAQVERGIAVVSIDYRLVTTAPDGTFVNSFPVPDTDVDHAVRFVKANAATWNLDPRRVLLAGASAGGHLAALAAAAPGVFVDPALPAELTTVSPRVQGVLDFVGISDFATFGDAGGWASGLMTAFLDCPALHVEQCDPAVVTAASVASHLDGNAPPAFLAYGGVDDLVVAGTQGTPLALAWSRARGDGGVDPAWARGVYYEQTTGGHNISASELNVTAMQTWIDAALAHPATTVAAKATTTAARHVG